MTKILTITLPDDLEQALEQMSRQTNQSPEAIIVELLSQKFTPTDTLPDPTTDPLLKLVGCITTDLTDVAENHDHYIANPPLHQQ